MTPYQKRLVRAIGTYVILKTVIYVGFRYLSNEALKVAVKAAERP